jgi:hypothetical protein
MKIIRWSRSMSLSTVLIIIFIYFIWSAIPIEIGGEPREITIADIDLDGRSDAIMESDRAGMRIITTSLLYLPIHFQIALFLTGVLLVYEENRQPFAF